MSFDMSWIDSSVSVSGSVASHSAWVVSDDWLYQDYSDVVLVDDPSLGWVIPEDSACCVWDPAVNKRFVRDVDDSWKEFDIPF